MGWLSSSARTSIDEEVERTVRSAIAFARGSDEPDGKDALDLVYASAGFERFPSRGWKDPA
jgi:TPP-dependent pyruvate/acetoin dehydrogenase alpha subunit